MTERPVRALAQTSGFHRIAGEGHEGLEAFLGGSRKIAQFDDALDRGGALEVRDRLINQHQRDRRNDEHELREDPELERLDLDHGDMPIYS